MSDKFIVKSFTVGPLETNCYVVADPATAQACVIDPGADPSVIKDYLVKHGLKLQFVINTHGHGDHIGANGALGAPIYIHPSDADFLTDPALNLSKMFMFGIRSPKAARTVNDGDVVEMGSLRLKIMHTPGHTPGSISIRLGGVVFTGDTLFAGGVGRTDFSYGDETILFRSIMERLLTLDDSTVIYPGHGPASTIGEEKRSNPFLE